MSTAIPGALAGSHSQKKSNWASTPRSIPGTVVLRDANGAFDGIASSVADNAITSAKIANDTIVDADIKSNAAISLSKLATGALPAAITVASANIVNGTIVNDDISNTAAIAHSKLADITSGQVLLGNASNVPTATAVTGDVTISDTGVTAIGSGVIVNADVNNTAAISGTKIAPNFGSQDVVTTGEVRLGTTSQYGAAGFTDPFVTIAQGNNATQAGISVSAWGGAGTTIPRILCARSNSSTIGTQTVVVSGSALGSVSFSGSDGTNFIEAAKIDAAVDGTPGANDMPGRLAFSTTADGASSPTERMRIDNVGTVFVGKTSDNINAAGVTLAGVGYIHSTRDSNTCISVNRLTNDGVLISFRQAGTEEGVISVSGSTVTLTGAHLSRWSQLPSGQERVDILRGTVLSNINEMCVWGNEQNEQLNRMKVSDVEGDPNVSGVFQSWDDDDETYTDDFYCAMTGDFIIRIAAGTTVQRGDLLMSAGDGTAKPQGDDIVRSKTVAKVTSTQVSCTYADGSYCVPCVLMAC